MSSPLWLQYIIAYIVILGHEVLFIVSLANLNSATGSEKLNRDRPRGHRTVGNGLATYLYVLEMKIRDNCKILE